VFNEGRDFPRAHTAPGLGHKVASAIGTAWAIEQAKTLNSHIPSTFLANRTCAQSTPPSTPSSPAAHPSTRGATAPAAA